MYKKGSGIKFYRFPTDLEQKRKWIAAVKCDNWLPNEHTWICSQHFITGEKSNNPLAPNYVPSIFNYVSSPIKRRLENNVGQFQRRQAIKRRRTVEIPAAACGAGVTVNEAGNSGTQDGVLTSNSNTSNDVSATNDCETNLLPINDNEICLVQRFADEEETEMLAENSESDGELGEMLEQTVDPSREEYEKREAAERLSQLDTLQLKTSEELTAKTGELLQIKSQLLATNDQLTETKKQVTEAKSELANMQKMHAQLQLENSELNKKVISEEMLSKDDKMVKYYTGLPSYELLKTIYELVVIGLPSDLFTGCSCSPFQQFIIVLMKLRLNLGDQDLAYRFAIHQSTVSRYFNKWLDILYHKLSVFVSWLKGQELLKTMPADFRENFGNVSSLLIVLKSL